MVYYRPIPGSGRLTTAKPDEALKKLESGAGTQSPIEVEYNGETLHRGLAADKFPFELYDELMPALDPLEQAVFGHIYRLSVAMGNDWLRTGMKELSGRTCMSPRRLLKSLALLTERGLIKPLHRNTEGTLYKVYTVYKSKPLAGEKGESPPLHVKADHKEPPPQRQKPLESPITEEAFAKKGSILTIRQIASEFFDKADKKPSDTDMDYAISQITYLLEDGFSRDEVRKAALFLAEKFGKKADPSKLPYYIHEVIKTD